MVTQTCSTDLKQLVHCISQIRIKFYQIDGKIERVRLDNNKIKFYQNGEVLTELSWINTKSNFIQVTEYLQELIQIKSVQTNAREQSKNSSASPSVT